MVKSTKHCLMKVLKIVLLFYDELTTILIEVQVIDKLRVAGVMKNKLRAQRGVYFS